MSKKYMPFPIDLTQYEEVERLTPLQFGILMRFIWHYWIKGEELPDTDYRLYHIARCPFKQWAQARESVHIALNTVFPPIKEARKHLLLIRQKFSKNADRSNVLKREARRNKNHRFVDADNTHVEISPVFSPAKRFNPGTYDHVERTKALESNELSTDKLLYDK